MIWLIPIGIGLVGAAGAVSGAVDIHEAKKRTDKATARLEGTQDELECKRMDVVNHAEWQAGWITECHAQTVRPLAEWINTHAGQAGISTEAFITDVVVQVPENPFSPSVTDALPELIVGGFTAVLGGAAAPGAVMALATTFGTASTGAAISGLTGIAAQNAALAYLGGGALAAGGGGIIAGEALLAASVPAVGLLLAGGTLFIVGDKAKTESHRYAAEVDKAVEAMQASMRLLDGVHRRMDEVKGVLDKLWDLSWWANDRLFAIENFDPKRDAAAFAEALMLARAISEISRMPIIDPETNNFNPDLDDLLRTYKEDK